MERTAVLVFSAVLLGMNMGTHLLVRSLFQKNAKKIFFYNLGITALFLAGLTAFQYYSWAQSELTKLLLPPTTPLSYFGYYALFRIWSPYIISSLFTMFFLSVLLKQEKVKMIFYDDEIWIASIALFHAVFPATLLFLICIVLFLLGGSAWKTFRSGSQLRMSAYHAWFPIALCVILVSYFFLDTTGLWLLLRP